MKNQKYKKERATYSQKETKTNKLPWTHLLKLKKKFKNDKIEAEKRVMRKREIERERDRERVRERETEIERARVSK